ncbi:MAG: hypothetical protein ACTSX4_04050, partial [Candidatus Helarchaeota archaeon]
MKLKKLSLELIFLIILMNFSSMLNVSGAGTLNVNIYNCDGYNLPGLGGTLKMIVYDSSYNYVEFDTVTYSGGESYKPISVYENFNSGYIEIYNTPNTGRGAEYWGSIAVNFPGSYNFYRNQPYFWDISWDHSTINPGDDISGTIWIKNPNTVSVNTRPTIYLDRDKNLPDDYTISGFSYQTADPGAVVGWNFNIGPITTSGVYHAYIETHVELSSAVLTDSGIWVSTVSVSFPGIPTLNTANGLRTADPTLYLDWETATGATSYQIQVDDSSSFSSPVIDTTTSSTSYTTTTLSSDIYYWRVRAFDSYSNYGDWTNYRSFEIDTECNSPSLLSPENGAYLASHTPYLDWSSVSEAVSYQLQVDDYSGFSSPVIDITTSSSSYTPTLNDDLYYWHVRAQDDLGNWSPYSSSRYFTVDTIGPNSPSLSSPSNGAVITDSSYNFQWSTVGDAVSYQIQINGPTNIDTT